MGANLFITLITFVNLNRTPDGFFGRGVVAYVFKLFRFRFFYFVCLLYLNYVQTRGIAIYQY